MSSKTSKRRTRRINTVESDDKKIEETIDLTDETKSNVSTDTDKTEGESPKKQKENGEKDSKKAKDGVENSSKSSKGKDSPKTKESTEEANNTEENNEHNLEKTNGQSQAGSDESNDLIGSQSSQTSQKTDSSGECQNSYEEPSSELEPLVLEEEEEEQDKELIFPPETPTDSTELSSDIDKSPVINRCRTRRSQTRNLPTPKSPKSLDLNGDSEKTEKTKKQSLEMIKEAEDKVGDEKSPKKSPQKSDLNLAETCDLTSSVDENESTLPTEEDKETVLPTKYGNNKHDFSDEVRVYVTRLQTKPETINNSPDDENISVGSTDNASCDSADKTVSDITDASIFVNYGNDTTRNIDLTATSNYIDNDDNTPSFIDTAKNCSYMEVCRTLSSRKALKSRPLLRSRLYQSNVDLTANNDFTDGVRKFVPITPGPLKRKMEDESLEDTKRIKTNEEGGLFSYISSPFKSKVGKSEIPSSTPKLTSFKYTNQTSSVIGEVSKIGLDDEKSVESKKWCSIM